jgi:hypothetical protein
LAKNCDGDLHGEAVISQHLAVEIAAFLAAAPIRVWKGYATPARKGLLKASKSDSPLT